MKLSSNMIPLHVPIKRHCSSEKPLYVEIWAQPLSVFTDTPPLVLHPE